MYREMFKPFVLTMTLALACPLLGGCGSSDKGQERTKQAVGSLKATREEVAEARKQIDENLAALGALEVPQADLPKAFAKYKEEIKETEDQAKRANERGVDMRARQAEYQKKWQEEMSQVSNPDLKAAAEKRAAKVGERYSEITEKSQAVRTAYEPFIRDLKDVQTYLSNDLTPAAVKAARPVFDKAKDAGADLNKKMDALAAEMDDVAASMSPGTPAK